MNSTNMDRNDQGIMRSIVLRIGNYLKTANADPNEPLPQDVQEDITQIAARLHNVEAFADIQLGFDRPAGQLKIAALRMIKGRPAFD